MRIFITVLTVILLAVASPASAATIVWTGQGANSNWSTAGNWSTGVAPANNVATDDVQLAGTVTASAVDTAWAIKSLTFNGNARAFNVTGSTLTLGTGGLTNNAAYAVETINNNITLSAAQSFTNNSSAPASTNIISTQLMKPADTLVLAGTTLDLNGNLLTVNGSAATRIDAKVTGSGGMTIGSSANGSTTVVTLTNAANDFTGTLTIGGTGNGTTTLRVNDIGALGGSGAIVNGTGAVSTLVYNNSTNAGISRAFTLNNGFVIANTGTGTLALTGGINGLNRAVTFRGPGNFAVNTNGLSVGTGQIDKFEAGTLTLNVASTFGALFVRGGTLEATAAISNGSATVNVGWFGANNFAPNNAPSILMANTGSVLRLSGAGTLSTTGIYSIGGGSSLILDNGTTNNNDRVGTGNIYLRGGTYSMIGRNDGVTNSSETVGTINLAGNYDASANVTTGSRFGGNGNVIKVDRNGAASITLTLGNAPIRHVGGNLGTTIDFQGAEALGTTSKILFTGGVNTAFLAAWNTVTTGTSTDFASYDTSNGVTQLVGARPSDLNTSISTDNVLTTANAALTGARAANSLKLGGNLDAAGNALTITSGGLIANTGTGNTISDSAAVGTSGMKSSGTEFFLYTPGSSSTTLTAKILEGAAGSVFTKTGAGELIYNSPSSTYTGATIVNSGTLKAGATNALPTGTVLIANDTGTFDLYGFDVQVADLLGHGTVNLTANKTLTITNNTGNNTTAKLDGFTGNLTGTGALTLNGSGTVLISGNNPNFAGTINVNAGQLQLDGNSAPDYFGQATLNLGNNSGAAVTLESRVGNTPSAFSTAATINIRGADVQVGPSIGNNARAYTFSGPVLFDKGTNLNQTFRPATTGGTVFNGQVTLSNSLTLAVGSVTNPVWTIAKGITQTGSVKITNAATITMNIQGDGFTSGSSNVLTLAGAGTNNVNTVQGVGSQKFEVGDGSTAPTVNFTSNNSSFDGGVELVSGTLVATGKTGTGVAGATPIAFSGPVGTGLLKVTGGLGTLRLGQTTLFNNVEVNGGVGNSFTFNDSGTSDATILRGVTSFKSAAAMTVNFDDNNTDNIVSNAVLYQDATFGGTATLRIGIGNNGTNRQVTFSTGNKFVEGFTSGAGTTTFTSGNFTLGGNAGLYGSGGAYIINGATATANTNYSTFSNGVTLQGGTLTFTAAGNSQGGNTSGPLGTGTFTLVGGTLSNSSNGNTVGNPFVIDGGNVVFSLNGNGGADFTFTGAGEFKNNAVISQSSSNSVNFTNTVTLTTNATLTGTQGVTLTGGLILPGDRTLTMNGVGSKTIAGPLTGSFTLDLVGTSQNVNLGSITGSGTVVRINDAAIKVTAANAGATYSGGTTLLAGSLFIGASSDGGFTQGPLGLGTFTISGGTVNTLSAGPYTLGNAVVINGNATVNDTNDSSVTFTGALTIANSPTLTVSTSNFGPYTFSGPIALNSDFTIAGNGPAIFSGLMTVNGNRTITSASGNGNGVNIKGGLAGTGNLIFAKDANPTRLVTINGGSGLSTHSGTTEIQSGVTVRTNTVNNTLSPNSVFIIDPGATLDIFGVGTGLGRLESIGGLSGGDATSRVTNGNTGTGYATLTINVAAGLQTYDGVINDGGNTLGIIKTGNGTQVLTGANVYNSNTGPATTINGGTLLANNATGSATGNNSVLVNSGGTLGGTGSVAGAVTVASGGTIAPGASPGTLTLGSLSMTDANVKIEIGGATPGDGTGFYDQVNVTGAIDNDTSSDLSLTLIGGFTPSDGDVYYIITRGGGGTLNGTSNYFTGLAEGATVSLGPAVGQITYLANWNGTPGASSTSGGNDVAIINVSVPEPASLSLVTFAVFALTWRRKR